MALRGDFQEHFLLTWRRTVLFATNVPRRGPNIRVREQQTTTSSTTKQVGTDAVTELGEALWAFSERIAHQV